MMTSERFISGKGIFWCKTKNGVESFVMKISIAGVFFLFSPAVGDTILVFFSSFLLLSSSW